MIPLPPYMYGQKSKTLDTLSVSVSESASASLSVSRSLSVSWSLSVSRSLSVSWSLSAWSLSESILWRGHSRTRHGPHGGPPLQPLDYI